ncbi:MAG: DsbA family protein [Polyangiaceae bacterium]
MLKSQLQSRAVEGLVRVGPGLLELRRWLPGRRGTALFCDPLDAHSWLLAAALWRERAALPPDFELHWVQAPERALDPEPELRVRHASRDVRLLADTYELGLEGGLRELSPEAALAAAASSLSGASGRARLEAVAKLASEVFVADEPPVGLDYSLASERLRAEMTQGSAVLRRLGHYQGAMLYHRGAWFWGVDRLPLWLAEVSGDGTLGDRSSGDGARVFRARPTTGAARAASEGARRLSLYFSFRSPYSYLALERAAALAERNGVELELRPVLPMVMRGLAVPPLKKFYLLFDAAREAKRLGIPFGRICDPVGRGAERCLAAFSATSGAQGVAFASRAMRAIWSEGVDVASDPGLRDVCEAVGLAWTRVQAAIADERWRALAAVNREQLTALGLWGVPSFEFRGQVVWGQDRLRLLERLMQLR